MKRTCTIDARSASVDLLLRNPMNPVVTAVPMLAPSARAMPAGNASSPSLAMAMAMPTVAADDCTIAVNTAPARIPAAGFSKPARMSRKGAKLRSGVIVSLMRPMP